MHHAEKKPIIARNGIEVDVALRSMGYSPREVYFKRDPRIYYEYDGETRGLFESSDLHGEYAKLCALYAADPAHIVKPIAEVKRIDDDNMHITGFLMEAASGVVLAALDYDSYYSNKTKSEIRRDRIRFISGLEELIKTVNGLHDKGLYHGDLNYFNIIVNERGSVKLIDPYVMDPKDELLDDTIRLDEYQKKLNHVRSLLRE